MFYTHTLKRLFSIGKPSDSANSENIQMNQVVLYETSCGFFHEPKQRDTSERHMSSLNQDKEEVFT